MKKWSKSTWLTVYSGNKLSLFSPILTDGSSYTSISVWDLKSVVHSLDVYAITHHSLSPHHHVIIHIYIIHLVNELHCFYHLTSSLKWPLVPKSYLRIISLVLLFVIVVFDPLSIKWCQLTSCLNRLENYIFYDAEWVCFNIHTFHFWRISQELLVQLSSNVAHNTFDWILWLS